LLIDVAFGPNFTSTQLKNSPFFPVTRTLGFLKANIDTTISALMVVSISALMVVSNIDTTISALMVVSMFAEKLVFYMVSLQGLDLSKATLC